MPLNACGIDASSKQKAEKSDIWDFILARLASMRVDSCTTEVKECLQSEDRCGKDYTQCIGLDTDTIIRMCPYDKLTGCQMVYGTDKIKGDDVYDELANMVQGIMINIDNNFLTECQNAANEAMIKVCGDTENCNGLTVDDGIGARSLEYKICEYEPFANSLDIDYYSCRTDISQIRDEELGRVVNTTQAGLGEITPFAGVLDGTIYWEAIEVDNEGKLTSVEAYMKKIDASDMSEKQKDKVRSELAQLQQSINNAIDAIEADPKVQYCMTGRTVQGMVKSTRRGEKTHEKIGEGGGARFPQLTKQMRMIIGTAALKQAKANYNKKYDKLNEKMLQDYAIIGERVAANEGENALDARREIARQACVSFAEMSILPKSPNPPKDSLGKVLGAVLVAGAIAAVPFTGGLSIGVAAAASAGAATAGIGVSAGVGILAAGAIAGGTLMSADKGHAKVADATGFERDLVGSKQMNQWDYKETITSTFEWDTLKCEKCVRSQKCSKYKKPLFGSRYCAGWAEPTNQCNTTQF